MDYKLPSESVFLRDLAVREFNFQYKRIIDPKLCSIRSIVATYGCTNGYEITTLDQADSLRLRMYFNLDEMDNFLPYRLETDSTIVQGGLGDEIYVMIGTINRYYVDSGVYKFRPIASAAVSDLLMYYVEGEVMQYIDGSNVEFLNVV